MQVIVNHRFYRRLAWGVVACAPVTALIWKAAEIIEAIALF
jgi:hypothetical protein